MPYKQIGNEKYLESESILVTKTVRDKLYVIKGTHIGCKLASDAELGPVDILGMRLEELYLVVPEGEHDEVLTLCSPEDFAESVLYVKKITPLV